MIPMDVAEEDEHFADFLLSLVLACAGARFARIFLYMGWSVRMLACRRDGWAARVLEELRGDKEEIDSLMKITKGRAVIKRHQRRNVFNTVSAQQYVDACTNI